MAENYSVDNEAYQIRAVIDKAALRDLALRYARAIDRRDAELLRSCYHDDAIDHHGNVFKGTREEFISWQPDIMGQFEVTAHYMLNTDYRLDGDKAQGELYFIAYHRTTANAESIVGGRYLDHYEKRDGTWRIAHRAIVWDFARENPVDEMQFAFLKSLGNIGAGAADASYAALSLFASPGTDPVA
jgi:ketosteroid isomerase-like protein